MKVQVELNLKVTLPTPVIFTNTFDM